MSRRTKKNERRGTRKKEMNMWDIERRKNVEKKMRPGDQMTEVEIMELMV